MTPKTLKHFIVGSAVASMALPGLAMAGTACVYVIGQTPTKTVTTPAIPILVGGSDGTSQPVRIHLDETSQNILGYSVTAPGADTGTDGTPLFNVPALNQYIPSFSATVPAVDLNRYRCTDVSGVSVPAIPYYIPASALTIPGGSVDVGAAFFNITGQKLAVPGKLFSFDHNQVFIPAQSGATPAPYLTTPNETLVFNLNDPASTVVSYLPPR